MSNNPENPSYDPYKDENEQFDENKVIDIVSGRYINTTIGFSSFALTDEYPSSWFKKEGKLPIVRLKCPSPGINQDEAMFYFLDATNITLDDIEVMLWITFKTFEAPTSHEFDSYTKHIPLGQTIKPADLCDFQTGSAIEIKVKSGIFENKIKMYKAVLIRNLMAMRLIDLNSANIKFIKSLIDLRKNLMSKEGFTDTPINVDEIKRQADRLSSNNNIIAAVAILDLWIKLTNKPGEDGYSSVMATTLSSYREDCEALTRLSTFTEENGITIPEFVFFIFNKDVTQDLTRIFHSGNEIEKIFTYTSYLVPLGLVKISPYSAAACPNLLTMIHLIDVVKYSKSSYRAILKDTKLAENLLPMAMIMAMRWQVYDEYALPVCLTKEDLEECKKIKDKIIRKEKTILMDFVASVGDERETEKISEEKRTKANRKKVTKFQIKNADFVTMYKWFIRDWDRKAPQICKREYYARLETILNEEPLERTIGSFLRQHVAYKENKRKAKARDLSQA